MKLGRLILTYREDLILPLKEYYLNSGRTQFLVIAYNRALVEAKGFKQGSHFKLEPYSGRGTGGSASGHQFIVWTQVAKKYPQIKAWVIYDYDVLVKPTDADIFKALKPNTYGTLGNRFANWQPGIEGKTTDDIYPYPYHYISAAEKKDQYQTKIENVLLKHYPITFNNVPTVMTGYTDFLAASRDDILMLDDPKLQALGTGGIDQAVHTVLAYNGRKQTDLRHHFATTISLDEDMPMPFNNPNDFSHPVKFWPTVEELKPKRKTTKSRAKIRR